MIAWFTRNIEFRFVCSKKKEGLGQAFWNLTRLIFFVESFKMTTYVVNYYKALKIESKLGVLDIFGPKLVFVHFV